MITFNNQPHVLNPLPGDLWHERMAVILLVITTFENLVLVSKRYVEDGQAFLGNSPTNLTFLTKEEFEKEISYCDCSSLNEKWCNVVKKIGLPDNLLDNEIINKKYIDKKQEIKYISLPEYIHAITPVKGDCWNFPDEKNISLHSIVVVGFYLKNFIIVARVNKGKKFLPKKANHLIIFTLKEFRNMVINIDFDFERGTRASSFQPAFYAAEVVEFEKLTDN